MTTYKNNNPFMTRVGQFEEGKSTLVVGCAINALRASWVKKEDFKMTMGKSKKVYSLPYDSIKDVRHTEWMSPKDNRKVWIIPVSEFKYEE